MQRVSRQQSRGRTARLRQIGRRQIYRHALVWKRKRRIDDGAPHTLPALFDRCLWKPHERESRQPRRQMCLDHHLNGVDAKQSAGGNASDGHRGSPIFCTRTSNRPKITEPQKERKKNEPEGSFFSKLS